MPIHNFAFYFAHYDIYSDAWYALPIQWTKNIKISTESKKFLLIFDSKTVLLVSVSGVMSSAGGDVVVPDKDKHFRKGSTRENFREGTVFYNHTTRCQLRHYILSSNSASKVLLKYPQVFIQVWTVCISVHNTESSKIERKRLKCITLDLSNNSATIIIDDLHCKKWNWNEDCCEQSILTRILTNWPDAQNIAIAQPLV